jgi:hypothetical protein
VNDPILPRAVVYRDSFTDGLIPLLTDHFREIRYIWARYGAKMQNVQDFNPDIVLQIMGDRVFRMNLRYSPEIQQERLKRRFAAGSEPVWRLDGWVPDLPLPRDARGHLPVLQVDLTARQATALELTWGASGETRVKVQPGRSKVYLPVFDPEAGPPFRLRLDGEPADSEIHSLELREIVR